MKLVEVKAKTNTWDCSTRTHTHSLSLSQEVVLLDPMVFFDYKEGREKRRKDIILYDAI